MYIVNEQMIPVMFLLHVHSLSHMFHEGPTPDVEILSRFGWLAARGGRAEEALEAIGLRPILSGLLRTAFIGGISAFGSPALEA